MVLAVGLSVLATVARAVVLVVVVALVLVVVLACVSVSLRLTHMHGGRGLWRPRVDSGQPIVRCAACCRAARFGVGAPPCRTGLRLPVNAHTT